MDLIVGVSRLLALAGPTRLLACALLSVAPLSLVAATSIARTGSVATAASCNSGYFGGISLSAAPYNRSELVALANGVCTDQKWHVETSLDGGRTWRLGATLAPTMSPSDIQPVAPQGTLLMIDLEHGGQLMRSADDGVTWSAVLSLRPFGGGGESEGQDIVADPSSPSRTFVCLRRGVVETTDSGVSWHRVIGAPRACGRLIIQPGSGRVVLVAGAGHAIARSADSGLHWTVVRGSARDAIGNYNIAFDTSSPNVVVAALGPPIDNRNFGIYRSTDAGQHWTLAARIPERQWFPGGSRTRGTVLYGGRFVAGPWFKYTDGGGGCEKLGWFVSSDGVGWHHVLRTRRICDQPDFGLGVALGDSVVTVGDLENAAGPIYRLGRADSSWTVVGQLQ